MRYKFRAWDVFEKEMDHEVTIDPNGKVAAYSPLDGQYIRGFSDSEMIPMQFTGLEDKNGTPIYEGDIVGGEKIAWTESGHYGGMESTLGVVELHLGRFIVSDVKTGAQPDVAVGSAYHEVIGNIYEHPHLLKGE